MQLDIRELLRSEAPRPRGSLDLSLVRARAHTLARRRNVLIAGGAVVVLAGAPAVGLQTGMFESDAPRVGSPGNQDLDCDVPRGYESDVTVYLSDDSGDGDIFDLYERVSAIDAVEAVYYITSEESLREFKDSYRDTPELWETLGPDSLPASFRVVLSDPEDADRIAQMIQEWKGVVDDVRVSRMTDEEVQRYFDQNNVLPPTRCPQASTPSDEGDGTK